jgi:hypothetical protein
VVKLGEGRSGSLRDGLSQALGDPTVEPASGCPKATGWWMRREMNWRFGGRDRSAL